MSVCLPLPTGVVQMDTDSEEELPSCDLP